jgi:hypothetical protein
MFTTGNLLPGLTHMKKMTAIVAALCHDIGHPAVNNNFLIHTQHELALQYMFESPLEKYHIYQTFSILSKPFNNFIAHFSKEDVLTFRTLLSQMILATDNAEHGRYTAMLRAQNDSLQQSQSDGTDLKLEEERLALQVALHAADISNPAKSMQTYKHWISLVTKEFFEQGDKERELGLAVGFGCDRNNVIPEGKFQAGFISALVRPLFQVRTECIYVCV